MLALVVLANISVYVAILNRGFAVDGWIKTLTNIQELVPVLLVSVFTGIINAQIGHNNKARLVFWKWSHPLPGSRAFTKYVNTDPRNQHRRTKKIPRSFADRAGRTERALVQMVPGVSNGT